MSKSAQRVANIMNKAADDIFFTLAILMCPRCGLQTVGQPVANKTAKVAVQQTQMGHYTVNQSVRKVVVSLANDLPIICRAFVHARKFRAFR